MSDDENAMYEICQGQEYEVILKEVNEKVEELQVNKYFYWHKTYFLFKNNK